MSSPVTAQLVPGGGANFGVTEDTDNKGGFRVVADIAARNAIPAGRRKEGMRVHVLDSDGMGTPADYDLGADLTSWTETSGTPSGGTDGQLVRKVSGSAAWSNDRVPDPSAESDGKVLTTSGGAATWAAASGGGLTSETIIDSGSDTAPTSSTSNLQRGMFFVGVNEVTVPSGKTKFRLRTTLEGNGNSAWLMCGEANPFDEAFEIPTLGADGYYVANPSATYGAGLAAMNFYDQASGTGFAISAGDYKAIVTFEWA